MRLNGYFVIRNYLQHRTQGFGVKTESDLLALRMPNQVEKLEGGTEQCNDRSLILPACQPLVDCVIAEVKEPSVEFNEPLRKPGGVELIRNALRMFGAFAHSDFDENGAASNLAKELHAKITSPKWDDIPSGHHGDVSVRMIVFAPAGAKHAGERAHVNLQHVLDITAGSEATESNALERMHGADCQVAGQARRRLTDHARELDRRRALDLAMRLLTAADVYFGRPSSSYRSSAWSR